MESIRLPRDRVFPIESRPQHIEVADPVLQSSSREDVETRRNELPSLMIFSNQQIEAIIITEAEHRAASQSNLHQNLFRLSTAHLALPYQRRFHRYNVGDLPMQGTFRRCDGFEHNFR